MNEITEKIDNNLFVHTINTNKFKTNLVAAFIIVDLKKEDITKNALIPSILKRGTENLKTMKEISNKMDDMYGAIFDASSDKIGDKQALQFYISTIDDEYALNNEKLLFESIDFMNDLIFNPKLIDGKFDEKYVAQEKEMLRELIKSKINDKSSYAMYRCMEEMFKGEPYGIYKYGREEGIDEINAINLYRQYEEVIKDSEIHFYVVGKFDKVEITNYVKENINIQNKTIDKTEHSYSEKLPNENAVQEINEKQDITQGKLVLGYEAGLNPSSFDDLIKMNVYSAILGSSANSKLFQNVREKASLAYTIRSLYIKHKAVMLITAGIEINKHDEALKLINIQFDDMQKGIFSDEDLKNAKVFLINTYRTYEDDESTLVDLSIGQYLLNMDSNIDEIIKKINNTTREDIINVANKIKLKVNYFLGN